MISVPIDSKVCIVFIQVENIQTPWLWLETWNMKSEDPWLSLTGRCPDHQLSVPDWVTGQTGVYTGQSQCDGSCSTPKVWLSHTTQLPLSALLTHH